MPVNLELIFPIKDAPSASSCLSRPVAFATLASLPKVRSIGWMPEFFVFAGETNAAGSGGFGPA